MGYLRPQIDKRYDKNCHTFIERKQNEGIVFSNVAGRTRQQHQEKGCYGSVSETTRRHLQIMRTDSSPNVYANEEA
jgi:hypothetical protein